MCIVISLSTYYEFGKSMFEFPYRVRVGLSKCSCSRIHVSEPYIDGNVELANWRDFLSFCSMCSCLFEELKSSHHLE
ncbi:hypothetical protein RB195_015122 [Necator americanus]|uniref:Uncharacterized protein n=1 Tax=Necator americanus TaxID=51031 RepID=A0ABR1E4D1_NECAM